MKTKHLLSLAIFAALLTSLGFAAKPEGVGKPDKAMAEMRKTEANQDADKMAEKADKMAEEAKEKAKGNADKGAEEAMEKAMKDQKSNASDKTDAVRKEAGKGSETGQAKREENSRKWWKFWGN